MNPVISEDRMYQALIERDSRFEGVFFVGVKTTGIFCRPSCRARKPNRENVEFFNNSKAALLHGYRPCFVCHPLEPQGSTPAEIKTLLAELKDHTDLRLRDCDLRQRGINPSWLRRWFKKTHNMTFQAYQRSLRINRAFGTIRQGEKIPHAAYDNGYESLSGFQDSFKKLTGFPPGKSQGKNIITITRIPTPLGPMLVGATDHGICLLEFTDRRMLETQIQRLQKKLHAVPIPGHSAHFDMLRQQLDEYFNGDRQRFDLPLVIPGTDFQKRVWKALMNIPYGQTRSYLQQAEAIHHPTSVRAVARANGDNRLAIIIPCHRVIGADGNLTGYGGGIWRKQWMLDLERKSAQ